MLIKSKIGSDTVLLSRASTNGLKPTSYHCINVPMYRESTPYIVGQEKKWLHLICWDGWSSTKWLSCQSIHYFALRAQNYNIFKITYIVLKHEHSYQYRVNLLYLKTITNHNSQSYTHITIASIDHLNLSRA